MSLSINTTESAAEHRQWLTEAVKTVSEAHIGFGATAQFAALSNLITIVEDQLIDYYGYRAETEPQPTVGDLLQAQVGTSPAKGRSSAKAK